MHLHQELTRFDIKCCISRKKVGRSITILDDNYYAWSFEMTMQKILTQKLSSAWLTLRLFFYTNSDFTDLKLVKYLLSLSHPLVEYNASFVWFGLSVE